LALLRIDALLACPFLSPAAPALTLPAAAGFSTRVLDRQCPPPWTSDSADAGPLLLQVFVRGNPFRGSAGEDEPWADWITTLVRQRRLAGLVVYGSPYLWDHLLARLPAEVPAVWSPGQMPAAQALALARIGLAPETTGATFAEERFTD
jgi:beta-glucosidase